MIKELRSPDRESIDSHVFATYSVVMRWEIKGVFIPQQVVIGIGFMRLLVVSTVIVIIQNLKIKRGGKKDNEEIQPTVKYGERAEGTWSRSGQQISFCFPGDLDGILTVFSPYLESKPLQTIANPPRPPF